MRHELHLENEGSYKFIVCECGACWWVWCFGFDWQYESSNNKTKMCPSRLYVRSWHEAKMQGKEYPANYQYELFG